MTENLYNVSKPAVVAPFDTDLNVKPVAVNEAVPAVVPLTERVYSPPSLMLLNTKAPGFAVVYAKLLFEKSIVVAAAALKADLLVIAPFTSKRDIGVVLLTPKNHCSK